MSTLIHRIRRSSTIGLEVRSELDEVLPKPTDEEVVVAIMDDAMSNGIACSYHEAWQVYSVVYKAVKQTRETGNPDYELSYAEMATVHRVIDVVMPDDTVPKRGTAYDKIQRNLLHGREIGITHTKDEVDNCVLRLELATVGR